VRHRVGGIGCDPGVEAGEVARDRLVLAPEFYGDGRVERQGVSSARPMFGVDRHDRRAGDGRQVGPGRQEGPLMPEQSTRPTPDPAPGDVAAEVHRQPVAERRAGAQQPIGRLARRQAPAKEQPRLRVRHALAIELILQISRNMPRSLHEQPQRHIPPIEPVQRRHVRPEVASQEDRSPTRAQGRVEMLAPAHIEPPERLDVGQPIEPIIPRQEPRHVRRQRRSELFRPRPQPRPHSRRRLANDPPPRRPRPMHHPS
jgi:hypothetical protein